MDCMKVGKYILNMRKEMGITQKQLADMLNLSDKTISKWERGLGCPDISILTELSKVFGVPVENILLGEINNINILGGNMKNIKFYMCQNCGNIVTSTRDIDISCCGKVLNKLDIRPLDEAHKVTIEPVEDELYITIDHPMTKEHYISFVSYATIDRVYTIKLYPEQNPQFRFPTVRGGKFIIGCNKDGLFSITN